MSFPIRRIGRDILIVAGLAWIPISPHLGAVFGGLILGLYAVAIVRDGVTHRSRRTLWPRFFGWLSLIAWTVLAPQWFTAAYWYHAMQMPVHIWIHATVPLVMLGFLGDALWFLIRMAWASGDKLSPVSFGSHLRNFFVKENGDV